MNKTQQDAVDRWLGEQAEAELRALSFTQIDIDALLDPPPALAVNVALSCLDYALTAWRRAHGEIDGILTIPLDWSANGLTVTCPSLSEQLAATWQYGPGLEVPGLYLIDVGYWRQYEAVEEYMAPVSGQEELPPGFVAYYRTWRHPDFGDEWARRIYVRTVA